MATYYVRKTGNDSTGDGSTALPWLTIDKGVQTIAAGDTLLIGDGEYAENTNGTLGYLRIIKTHALLVTTIAAENGASGDVTIVGLSSATANCQIQNSNRVTFRYLKFKNRLASQLAAVRCVTTCAYIRFEYCTFVQVGDGSNIQNGLLCDPDTGITHDNWTLLECTAQRADSKYIPINVAPTNAGVISNWEITDCTIHGGAAAVAINGAQSLTISGGTLSANGGSCVKLGTDAATGGLSTTVTVSNVTIDMTGASIGHALLVGNGCVNCVIDGVKIYTSFDHAIVLKEHGATGGTEVKGCTFTGGTGAAVLLKAARNANVHHNILYASSSLGVIYVTAGDTGNKNIDNTLSANRATATGSGIMFYWVAGADGGGNVCDYNAYQIGANGWGTLPTGVVSGATLAALQSAWNAYGTGTNDDHSYLTESSFFSTQTIEVNCMIAARWYCSLAEIVADLGLTGVKDEAQGLRVIKAASQYFDQRGGQFIPHTEQRTFNGGGGVDLWIDPLITATAITVYEGDTPYTLTSADYLYNPSNRWWANGPHTRLEVDLDGLIGAWFNGQQNVLITGRWGLYEKTRLTGATVASQTDTSTTLTVDNGAALSPGMIVLIGTEQEAIEATGAATDSAVNTSGALDNSQEEIAVSNSALLSIGEVIKVDFEQMRVIDIQSNTLLVERGYNGTKRVTHLTGLDIYVYRSFSVIRGVNGTTAAAHSGTSVYRCLPPDDVNYLCRQIAALMLKKSQSGFAGKVGNADTGETFYFNEFPNDPIGKILTKYTVIQ